MPLPPTAISLLAHQGARSSSRRATSTLPLQPCHVSPHACTPHARIFATTATPLAATTSFGFSQAPLAATIHAALQQSSTAEPRTSLAMAPATLPSPSVPPRPEARGPRARGPASRRTLFAATWRAISCSVRCPCSRERMLSTWVGGSVGAGGGVGSGRAVLVGGCRRAAGAVSYELA